MHKVAAIGDRESVSGFRAIGMDVFTPYGEDECKSLLKELCEGDYAIIYITEEYGEYCKDIIRKYGEAISPAIILIPGVRNNTGEGMRQLSLSVEKAVGSQLPE